MSKKTFHAIQFVDRICNPIYRCNINIICTPTKYVTEKSELDSRINRIVPKTVIADKPSLSHMRVSDFALENLQAVGAPLNPAFLSHDVNTQLRYAEDNVARLSQTIETSK